VVGRVPPVLVEAPALDGVVAPSFLVSGALAAADIEVTVKVLALDGTVLGEGTGGAVDTAAGPPTPFVVRIDADPAASGEAIAFVNGSDGSEARVPIVVAPPGP